MAKFARELVAAFLSPPAYTMDDGTGTKVLYLRRADADDGFVVARVERTGSPLDLRIVATEGENPYVGSSACPET